MGLKDILPVEKVYDDLLSPSVKQVGLALASVFKTVRFSVAPFDIMASLYDTRWQSFIKRLTDKVKPDNVVDGQPQIVIPVLNALDLQQEDSLLSELFINLLSASIDKTKQDLAHPAFPNILSQLSHDEAVLLFHLKKKYFLINFVYEPDTPKLLGEDFESIISLHIAEDFIKKKINNPQYLLLYLRHLKALEVLIEKNLYDDLFWGGTESFEGFPPNSIIKLSPFGKLFADACIPDEFVGL